MCVNSFCLINGIISLTIQNHIFSLERALRLRFKMGSLTLRKSSFCSSKKLLYRNSDKHPRWFISVGGPRLLLWPFEMVENLIFKQNFLQCSSLSKARDEFISPSVITLSLTFRQMPFSNFWTYLLNPSLSMVQNDSFWPSEMAWMLTIREKKFLRKFSLFEDRDTFLWTSETFYFVNFWVQVFRWKFSIGGPIPGLWPSKKIFPLLKFFIVSMKNSLYLRSEMVFLTIQNALKLWPSDKRLC